VAVALDQELIGLLAIEDPIRPDAAATIQALQRRGLRVKLLTGDRVETAHHLAQALGIAPADVMAQVPPAGKAEAIARLQAAGHRVGMVGDGINDAPALAKADVGIALQSGTDVATETAGIVLVADRLTAVTAALDLSRATFGKIRQNLWWAFGYNLLAIPAAAGALLPMYHFTLTPAGAGLLMALSSISVATNSLLLRFQMGRSGARG
jgi:P-type Cu2+ transporter